MFCEGRLIHRKKSLSPPVDRHRVAFPGDHLGGHAMRSSTISVRSFPRSSTANAAIIITETAAAATLVTFLSLPTLLQLLRAPEIDQLGVPPSAQHNVTRFDVAVHETICVHVRDGQDYLGGVKSCYGDLSCFFSVHNKKKMSGGNDAARLDGTHIEGTIKKT